MLASAVRVGHKAHHGDATGARAVPVGGPWTPSWGSHGGFRGVEDSLGIFPNFRRITSATMEAHKRAVCVMAKRVVLRTYRCVIMAWNTTYRTPTFSASVNGN